MDRRLAGYGPWGRKGSDTTEVTGQVEIHCICTKIHCAFSLLYNR